MASKHHAVSAMNVGKPAATARALPLRFGNICLLPR